MYFLRIFFFGLYSQKITWHRKLYINKILALMFNRSDLIFRKFYSEKKISALKKFIKSSEIVEK